MIHARSRLALRIAGALIVALSAGSAFVGVDAFGPGVSRTTMGSVTVSKVVFPVVPPPTGLRCETEWHGRDAELRWDPVTGAERYLVYHGRPFGGSSQLLANLKAPRTKYDDLRRSLLKHRYYVTAVNAGNASDPSETIRVRCAPKRDFYHGPHDLKDHHRRDEDDHGSPVTRVASMFMSFIGRPPDEPAPTPAVETPVSTERVEELTWVADGRSKSFVVLRGEESGGPYEEIATTTEARHLDSGLAPAVTYYYVVVGVDAEGAESEPTNEMTALPRAPVTPSPTPTASPTPSTSTKAAPTATAKATASGSTAASQPAVTPPYGPPALGSDGPPPAPTPPSRPAPPRPGATSTPTRAATPSSQ